MRETMPGYFTSVCCVANGKCKNLVIQAVSTFTNTSFACWNTILHILVLLVRKELFGNGTLEFQSMIGFNIFGHIHQLELLNFPVPVMPKSQTDIFSLIQDCLKVQAGQIHGKVLVIS